MYDLQEKDFGEFQKDELYTELINDESFDTNFQSREILQRVDTLRASLG